MNRALFILGACMTVSACGQPHKGGAVTVDADLFSRPAELQRLFAESAAPLGPRHLEASSSLELHPPGRPVESLHETFRLDAGAAQLHVLHENDHDDGLEAIVTNGKLYVRPRYGKFVARRAEATEVAHLRSNVEGVAAAYLRLVGPWLSLCVAQATVLNGRSVRVVQIARRDSPDRSLRGHDSEASWRDGVDVTQLGGEFVVDASTGLPIDGHLDATYTFTRSDLSGPVSAQLHYEQKSTAVPEAIAAPNEVTTLKRPRPLLDRQALLDGLK